MTLNLTKCEFAKPEVKFVGHFWAPGNEDQTLSVWKVLLRWSDPGPKRSFANCWERLAIIENIYHILLT